MINVLYYHICWSKRADPEEEIARKRGTGEGGARDRQTDRQTDRHRQRQSERQRERERDRQTDREREREN